MDKIISMTTLKELLVKDSDELEEKEMIMITEEEKSE